MTDIAVPVQWYRCSCGFNGQMTGPRADIVHWLVTTHLKNKGADHQMIVKTIGSEIVVESSPSCLWCGAKENLVRDHENDGWVCPEHARKGLTA